jgi:anaerobic selenocysteine-containing dehydrogenase
MTYQWWIGACNELTQDNLDPISKTPETKYCAVELTPLRINAGLRTLRHRRTSP